MVSAMGVLGDELLRILDLAGNGVVARKGQAAVKSWLWFWKRKHSQLAQVESMKHYIKWEAKQYGLRGSRRVGRRCGVEAGTAPPGAGRP